MALNNNSTKYENIIEMLIVQMDEQYAKQQIGRWNVQSSGHMVDLEFDVKFVKIDFNNLLFVFLK